uniref:Uncharacterized protein n=1 Tax=Aedes aegypti TaxID=7159 RepID=A0A6E8P7S5_AEDAE|nr:uncharacterized LOC125446210 [Aedes aegypti]
MSHPSEKSLDDQQLLSPSETYRELLHSAREADRQHVLTGAGSADEADFPNISFESYRPEDEDEEAAAALEDYEEDSLRQEPIDLQRILTEADIDWDASGAEDVLGAMGFDEDRYVPQEGEFLEDSYFPGFLDDAIQGKVPYGGEVVVQKGDTSVVEGMSLLEAFDRRVEHDQQQVKDRLGLSDVSWSSAAGTVDEMDILPVTDYDVLAAIAGIRIDKKIQNMPETELTKAIDCLTRAEIMNEYQRKYEVMQDMTKKIVGRLTVDGKESPKVEPIGPRFPKCPGGAGGGGDGELKPLEIVTYIGSTRSKIGK